MSATLTNMSAFYSRRRRAVAKKRIVRAGNSSQANRQPRRPRRRRIGPAIKIVHRTTRLLAPDMHVRYAADVAEGSIDREAWSKVVKQLIAQETGTPAKPEGNKSRFAALVKVTYKTVLRWTKQGSDVSEDSVRQVAQALHISPLELLVRVGYYTDSDLTAATRATSPTAVDQSDPALQVILEADVPPRVQQRMIQRLQQLRERDAERQVEEVKWWIDQAGGA